MSLSLFLEKLNSNAAISFDETMTVINANYHYQPSEFINGLDEEILINQAGTNEGSCKIFAFAKIHQLNQQQTLNLFGDYYRVDVLNNPKETGHQNIRNFIKFGWNGISFQGSALNKIC